MTNDEWSTRMDELWKIGAAAKRAVRHKESELAEAKVKEELAWKIWYEEDEAWDLWRKNDKAESALMNEKYLIALANIDVDRMAWRNSEEGIQYKASLDAFKLKDGAK